jgi:hypothetical protein
MANCSGVGLMTPEKKIAGWHAIPLQRLPERPFRTLPGGSLRKFLRRLSQFPLSFLAKSRWAPRSSGELRFRAMPPLQVSLQLIKNRKTTGRLQACRLNASPHSAGYSSSYCSTNLECPRFLSSFRPPFLGPFFTLKRQLTRFQ